MVREGLLEEVMPALTFKFQSGQQGDDDRALPGGCKYERQRDKKIIVGIDWESSRLCEVKL